MLLWFSGFCATLTHTHQRESEKFGVKKRQCSDGLIHSHTGWVQLACPVRPPARNNKHSWRDPGPAVHRQTPEPVNRTTAARPGEPHETGPVFTKVWGSLLRGKTYRDGIYAYKVYVCEWRSYLKIFWEAILVVRVEFWYMLDNCLTGIASISSETEGEKKMYPPFCCLILRKPYSRKYHKEDFHFHFFIHFTKFHFEYILNIFLNTAITRTNITIL